MGKELDNIVKGAQSFGKIYTTIGTVITTIIAIVLLVLAIYKITHKERESMETLAKIKMATCNSHITNGRIYYLCNLGISYTVGGVEYTSNQITDTDRLYKVDDIIEVQYDPLDPNVVRLKTISNKSLGYILLVISMLMLLVTWGWWYFVQHNSFAAAGMGVKGFGDITGMFR